MSKAKTYQVELSRTPAAVVEKARKVAGKNGFDFSGDETAGAFVGKGVHGRYRIDGVQMAITIERKPLIVPWSIIESSIKSFFA